MKKISIRVVDDKLTDVVQKILDEAPFFSLMTEGVVSTTDGAQTLFSEIPPGIERDKKFVFLIEESGDPIGVCDYINGYPQDEIGFVGLFLLRESAQKKGVGRMAFELIEEFARKSDIKAIQLGVVDSNPVHGFWKKMGFEKEVRTRPHKGLKLESTVRVFEKKL